MEKNIFVVGSVASGKSTLMDKLSSYYNIGVLDSGKLFRIASYILSTMDSNLILKNNDNQLVINNRRKYIQKLEKSMQDVDFKGNDIVFNNEVVKNEILYSKTVNEILPVITNDKMIRNVIISHMNSMLSKKDKYVLTGHNLDDIDTTKFITVFLHVDDEVAAKRLISREKNNYQTMEEALKHLTERNAKDGIEETRQEIQYLYNAFEINTSNLSELEVYNQVIKKINNILEKDRKFNKLQNNAIKRENFSWLTNPIFDVLKCYIEILIDTNELPSFISKTDLIYQTLTKLALYRLDDVFLGNNQNLKELERRIIENRDVNVADKLNDMLVKDELKINTTLVIEEINKQMQRIIDLYSKNKALEIMQIINNINYSNRYSLKDITYAKIDKETSEFIATNCHYLHTPRIDEYASYAAFVPDVDFPIAWVSYSRQDREYKKQLLYEMGVEPNRTLEMTRAWCSNYAPKNIMSSLFQYSFNDINNNWIAKKKFLGVSTTINPNLSFKASSFLGANFIPCALRPARYTYQKINEDYQYCTRRGLNGSDYIENKIKILPLNEMFMCLDTEYREKLRKLDIYQIDKGLYDKVLGGKTYE